MDNKFQLLLKSIGDNYFKEQEPLKYHTYLKLGGPAKLFFVALKVREIIKIITACRELKLPYLIFGTGSKMVIADAGFEGVVIKNRTNQIEIVSVKGKVSRTGIGIEEAIVEAESGVTMENFAIFLDKQGLKNSEFVNTHGSIGGSIFMNKMVQNKVESIKILGSNKEVEKIAVGSLNLGLHVILSVVFRIKSKEQTS